MMMMMMMMMMCVCKTEMKKDITLRTEVFKWMWREGIPGRRSTRQRQ